MPPWRRQEHPKGFFFPCTRSCTSYTKLTCFTRNLKTLFYNITSTQLPWKVQGTLLLFRPISATCRLNKTLLQFPSIISYRAHCWMVLSNTGKNRNLPWGKTNRKCCSGIIFRIHLTPTFS